MVIWVKDKNGQVKGNYNNNTILNTRVYGVMFPDGAVCQYAANKIAENMYSQVESNVHHNLLLKEVTNHSKSAMDVPIDDNFVVSNTGRKVLERLPMDGISSVYGKMVVPRWPH